MTARAGHAPSLEGCPAAHRSPQKMSPELKSESCPVAQRWHYEFPATRHRADSEQLRGVGYTIRGSLAVTGAIDTTCDETEF